jgi:hypothetical protein
LLRIPEVTLDGLSGLVTEGTGTGSASLSQYERDISIKINVCQSESSELRQTHAGIQEQSNDGRVTSIVETSAVHAPEQAGELGFFQDGYWALWDGRGAEGSHR